MRRWKGAQPETVIIVDDGRNPRSWRRVAPGKAARILSEPERSDWVDRVLRSSVLVATALALAAAVVRLLA